MINSDLVQRHLLFLGWTDRDFARKTGITYNRLMEIIWNIGAPCTDITSHRIADALHVLHRDLTGRVHLSANLFLKIAWALDVPPERIMQAKRPAKKQAKDSLPPK